MKKKIKSELHICGESSRGYADHSINHDKEWKILKRKKEKRQNLIMTESTMSSGRVFAKAGKNGKRSRDNTANSCLLALGFV